MHLDICSCLSCLVNCFLYAALLVRSFVFLFSFFCLFHVLGPCLCLWLGGSVVGGCGGGFGYSYMVIDMYVPV